MSQTPQGRRTEEMVLVIIGDLMRLRGGTTPEIAERAGYNRMTVRRVVNRLLREGKAYEEPVGGGNKRLINLTQRGLDARAQAKKGDA